MGCIERIAGNTYPTAGNTDSWWETAAHIGNSAWCSGMTWGVGWGEGVTWEGGSGERGHSYTDS